MRWWVLLVCGLLGVHLSLAARKECGHACITFTAACCSCLNCASSNRFGRRRRSAPIVRALAFPLLRVALPARRPLPRSPTHRRYVLLH